MVTDEDENVRDQVVHSLCDGAPKTRETDVIEGKNISKKLGVKFSQPSKRCGMTNLKRSGEEFERHSMSIAEQETGTYSKCYCKHCRKSLYNGTTSIALHFNDRPR